MEEGKKYLAGNIIFSYAKMRKLIKIGNALNDLWSNEFSARLVGSTGHDSGDTNTYAHVQDFHHKRFTRILRTALIAQ